VGEYQGDQGIERGSLEEIEVGVPGWFSWLSVWLLISAQVLISGPSVQAPLCAQHWEWSPLKKKKFI